MKIKITPGVRFIQGLVTITNTPVGGGGGPAPANNELWAWGYNGYGRLGTGNTTTYSSPVQIGGLTDWASVDGGGSFTLAIKTDGSLWAWGNGTDGGKLGLGDTNNRSSPVQVGSLTDWASVHPAARHTAAIKTNGSLWTWGRGDRGPLGHGDIVYRSSPTQVGILTDWVNTSTGNFNTLAIKTNGSLWSWGLNYNGTLGLGDGGAGTYRSSPVQVGSLTDWVTCHSASESSFAIKTDGSLWAWGDNGANGKLGLEDTANRSSPVQVGALTDWVSISPGGSGSVSAIKTDGTIWGWGRNDVGQLGQEDTITRSSPVQVGVLSDWTSVNITRYSHALKNDGTIWSWGSGTFGTLGHGNTTAYSSPVQIGALTTWTGVTIYSIAAFALKPTV